MTFLWWRNLASSFFVCLFDSIDSYICAFAASDISINIHKHRSYFLVLFFWVTVHLYIGFLCHLDDISNPVYLVNGRMSFSKHKWVCWDVSFSNIALNPLNSRFSHNSAIIWVCIISCCGFPGLSIMITAATFRSIGTYCSLKEVLIRWVYFVTLSLSDSCFRIAPVMRSGVFVGLILSY